MFNTQIVLHHKYSLLLYHRRNTRHNQSIWYRNGSTSKLPLSKFSYFLQFHYFQHYSQLWMNPIFTPLFLSHCACLKWWSGIPLLSVESGPISQFSFPAFQRPQQIQFFVHNVYHLQRMTCKATRRWKNNTTSKNQTWPWKPATKDCQNMQSIQLLSQKSTCIQWECREARATRRSTVQKWYPDELSRVADLVRYISVNMPTTSNYSLLQDNDVTHFHCTSFHIVKCLPSSTKWSQLSYYVRETSLPSQSAQLHLVVLFSLDHSNALQQRSPPCPNVLMTWEHK